MKPPTTWAQFLAVCKKIKASGETPIAVGGSQDTWASWIFPGGMFLADVLGKNPNWIVQRKADKVHFTDPLVAHPFNKWAALFKAGYFNKNALSLNYAGMQQEFLEGKEAMYPMGTWAASATAVAFTHGSNDYLRAREQRGHRIRPRRSGLAARRLRRCFALVLMRSNIRPRP